MSRTITHECEECNYEETWYDKEDVSFNFMTCPYCELIFCIDCATAHLKEEV